jgi:hypothetical protein
MIALLGCALLAACGAGASTAGSRPSRAELERYLAQVEPIRLAVNRLLQGADPILGALHEHQIDRALAGRRLDALERRFAEYAVAIASVAPREANLARLHDEYAHTYVLEDAYLSALAAGVADGGLSSLPDTQSQQRAAIIAWRIGLTVLARRAGAPLPADLQQAGRGEIAPAPQGTS